MSAKPASRRRYAPRLPREERREQLLDAALRIIARDGFVGVSMEGVAREAEIAKTVVYDAFPNQQDLLAALLEREAERVLSAIASAIPDELTGSPRDILVSSLVTVLESVRRDPDTWRLVLLPSDGAPAALRIEMDRHRERLLEQMQPIVAWGTRRMGLGHLDPELTAHTILATSENAARLTLTQPRRFTPKRLAAYAADLVAALMPPQR